MTSIFFFRSMYDKTIIKFGFCGIQNDQVLGKSRQPLASTDNPTSTWPGLFWISQKSHPILV